ncbi:MAG: hypothetical protein ACE5EH_01895 [Gammaproteobacteria bacterium]
MYALPLPSTRLAVTLVVPPADKELTPSDRTPAVKALPDPLPKKTVVDELSGVVDVDELVVEVVVELDAASWLLSEKHDDTNAPSIKISVSFAINRIFVAPWSGQSLVSNWLIHHSGSNMFCFVTLSINL